MKQGQSIKKVTLIKGINHIELDRIYPISPIKDPHITEIDYLIDSEVMKHNSTYANNLNITTDADMTLDILCGAGYIAEDPQSYRHQITRNAGYRGQHPRFP